jgi:colanic acid/amylovoran biosynthesis glycosyltransferase
VGNCDRLSERAFSAGGSGAVKRVLIFRNELLPRSETFILAQAMALRSFEAYFAGVHPAINSLDLPTEQVFVSSLPSFAGKARRRLFWRAAVAPGFYSRLQKLRVGLVHAHFALDGAAALAICKHLKLPLVVTLHGFDVSSSDDSLRRSEEGRLYLRRREELWEKTAVFICVSEFIRGKALEKGFPESKLRVHYTGVDLSVFEEQAVERDPNLIVFTGRLVEKKGCRYLLDALARVREQHPAAHLVVIGAGPMDGVLKEQAAALKLSCEFLGVQPVDVVRQYLARARVFCVPSVTAANGDSEGLGMVFAEAQAMGTPVASFRHGGISEIVRDGSTGLLAPEGDTEGLAANLLRLLRDDALWRELSGNGVRSMRTSFDIQKQTAVLEDIYLDVMRGRLTSAG